MLSLSYKNAADCVEAFNFTSRYLDLSVTAHIIALLHIA